MEFLQQKKRLKGFVNKLKAANLRDTIKKKTHLRLRFYTTLRDFIQGAGGRSPHAYFSWYEKQLDYRMKVQPSWKKAYHRLTSSKSDRSFRNFLAACEADLSGKTDFFSAIKAWLPDDEFRVLKSAQSTNISKEINLAIKICEEKEKTKKQMASVIKKNIPMFIMGFVVHFILYEFVYASFVNPGDIQNKSISEMNITEMVYVTYNFIKNNWILLGVAIVAVGVFISWSNKNWHKRGFNIRANYIDFLPPYSLSKVKEQYNFLMLLNSFIQSGKNFQDAVDEASAGSTPYVKRHIAEIKRNSTKAANEAINIYFLGDYGCDIRDRGENVALSEAINDLLPGITQKKEERLESVIAVSMWLTTKPLIYGTLGISAFGVVLSIIDLITSTGALDSGML
jgi:hypothetical protein